MVLALLLMQMLCSQATSAKSREEKRARLAEKVKTAILKLGVGRDARIELKLQDERKLVGHISEVKDESFVVTNVKTGTATSVAYADVTQVKGHHMATGTKIAIGVGIGVAVAVIAIAIWWHSHGLWD